MTPCFTVVIPTFDRQDTVARAVRSVLRQDVDLEVIVVDDGSRDGTQRVLAGIVDPRLRVRHQPNRGVSAARNAGAADATAPLLTFLDSDDEALPGWLTGLSEHLTNEGVGIACCGLERCHENGRVESVPPRSMGPAFADVRGLFVTGGTFACRTELFRGSGGYQERLRYGENTELALRLVRACVERGLAVRATEAAFVRQYWAGSRRYPQASVAESAEYVLSEHADIIRADRGFVADYLTAAAVNRAALGESRAARRHLLHAVLRQPVRMRRWVRLAASFTPLLSRRNPGGGR